jgi:hypothetical protein
MVHCGPGIAHNGRLCLLVAQVEMVDSLKALDLNLNVTYLPVCRGIVCCRLVSHLVKCFTGRHPLILNPVTILYL